jgi:hypothetical protein
LLGRNVLDFRDWNSYQERSAPALSAPAAPVAVSSPSRNERTAAAPRSLAGRAVLTPGGGAVASRRSTAREVLAASPRPAQGTRTTARRATTKTAAPSTTKRSDDDVTPMRSAPAAPKPPTNETAGQSEVHVTVGGQDITVPDGATVAVHVRDGQTVGVSTTPAPASGG